MITNCPVCGKLTAIHWPQHWIYRRGDTYYCSWNCLDVDITKDLKLMHEVQRKRRERKMYNKLKKDGTPAKKSGPKPKKVEIPEPVSGGEWEKVETPEKIVPIEKIDKIVPPKPLVYDGYTVRCIEGVMGKFYYDKSYDRLDWTTPEGEEVSFRPSAWKVFATEELPKVMAILGVEL